MMTLMPVAAFAAESDAAVTKVTASTNEVTITFDKLLNTAASISGFTVNDTAVTASNASSNGTTVTLTGVTLAVGANVTVSYDGAGALADVQGNLVKAFTETTTVPVPVAPKLTQVRGTAEAGSTVVIPFDSTLQVSASTNGFTATGKTVTAVSVSDNELTVTLNTALVAGDMITISYNANAASADLAGGNGAKVASFDYEVTVPADGATDVAADRSAFVATEGDTSVKTLGQTDVKDSNNSVEFYFDANNAYGNTASGVLDMYVWAVDENGAVSSALVLTKKAEAVGADLVVGAKGAVYNNAYKVEKVANGDTFTVAFTKAGNYTVYAGVEKGSTATSNLSNMQLVSGEKANFSVITVTGTSVNPDVAYSAKVTPVDQMAALGYKVTANGTNAITAAQSAKGDALGILEITPNNIETNNITVTFYSEDETLTGKTVAISTDSANVTVNKESAKTNILGQIQLKVSASREGKYNIYLEIEGVQYVLEVNAGNTSAAYIETSNQPKAPKALYSNATSIRFRVTDINGNIVKTLTDEGMDGIEGNTATGKYVVLTEKPAGSNMVSTDLTLDYDDDKEEFKLVTPSFDAEGTYSVKVILDNGAFATATWEVKKFQTPVELRIDYSTKTVELGGQITPDQVVYVDANGVEKAATDADFAATGYAIESLDGRTVTVKSDEKYVGAKINVTAVSTRYDLVGTAELTVAEGASAIKFADKTAEVNVNNKIVWNIVDSNDNKVALTTSNATAVSIADINYVVLDKPEGAKVSVYDATVKADLLKKGEGKMALTSDKVGNVTVQAIVKAEYKKATTATTAAVNQVKYYTGTQIFAVGNGSVGDVVVMSIGSNEIIVNDAKATIDAAPMVQNDRTYVPFRALAEAFGAEVAYDEATQAVTAELNGVTVVMTIGSATYTVNGEEKTMDVAPFINGSRTMVPVRFAAEAFGIKVIPTYDENGATADILFNL